MTTIRLSAGTDRRSRRERYDADEVRARADLVLIVQQEYGAQIRRVGSRDVTHCLLPGHDDHHPSMDLAYRNGTWWWACRSQCQAHGDIFALVMRIEGCTFPEAVERVAGWCGIGPSPSSWTPSRRIERPRPEPKPWVQPVDKARTLDGDEARELLKRFVAGRGWSPWVIDEFRLTAVESQQVRWVRFPYFDLFDTLTWWQNRNADPTAGHSDRWRSPGGAEPLDPFGWQRLPVLDQTGSRDVWLCEGPTDAVALVDGSGPDRPVVALGLPGGSMRSVLARVAGDLAGLTCWVIFDGDAAGEKYRALVDGTLVASTVMHVHVPGGHSDVSDWRKAAGDDFYEQLVEAHLIALGGGA